jgi:hypothetical protein
MIDPDGIIVSQHNYNNIIKLGNLPEFDFIVWDLEDDKELKKYYTAVEKEVRKSYEYRAMIKFLKDNMGMDQCSFIKVSNKDSRDIKIEIHHYPFTLYDVVTIVYRKRCHYREPLDVQMISKEIMLLHYKLLIGLIPLSVTVHQLTHAGKIFIPVQNVLGRYREFINFYKEFCDEEQLETLDRIEKYSIEQTTDLFRTSEILDQNNITIEATNKEYQLPDLNNMEAVMNTRIEDIKQNNYILPTIKDEKDLYKEDTNKDRRTIVCPIYYSRKE